MKRQDIVFGGILVLVIAIAYFYFKNEPAPTVPIEENKSQAIDQKVKDKFNATLPENIEKTELTSSKNDYFAAATRAYENGDFELTVLADLPDPESGKFYQAWLNTGDGQMLSLGKLTMAKGGWLVNYHSKTDQSEYNEVIVTLESTLDNTPEERVLSGSF